MRLDLFGLSYSFPGKVSFTAIFSDDAVDFSFGSSLAVEAEAKKSSLNWRSSSRLSEFKWLWRTLLTESERLKEIKFHLPTLFHSLDAKCDSSLCGLSNCGPSPCGFSPCGAVPCLVVPRHAARSFSPSPIYLLNRCSWWWLVKINDINLFLGLV